MSLIKGTHHIALKPAGRAALEKTIHFYHDLLGMEIIRTWEDGSGVFIWTGNSILEINDNGEPDQPQGSIHHFALLTDDVDECVRRVEAEGYQVYMEAQNMTLPHREGGMPIRMAFCKGPVGEDVEFFTEL